MIRLIVLVVLWWQSALAMFPVFDWHSMWKLNEQLIQMRKSYHELLSLRQLAKDQVKAVKDNLSGLSHFGSLDNDTQSILQRFRATTDIDAEDVKSKLALVQYQGMKTNLIELQKESALTQQHSEWLSEDLKVTNLTAQQSAQDIDRYPSRQKVLKHLTHSVSQAKTVKSTADLNARLLGELGYLQNQQLQHAALLNRQLAQQKAERLAVRLAESDFTSPSLNHPVGLPHSVPEGSPVDSNEVDSSGVPP